MAFHEGLKCLFRVDISKSTRSTREPTLLGKSSTGVEINAYYALDRSVRVVILNKIHRRQGLLPDRFSFMGVLGLCADPFYYWGGLQFHCQTIKLKLDSMTIIGNMLISMYSKFCLIEDTEKMFTLIGEKDVITWNTMIAACSQCDDHGKALCAYREMENESNQRPDDFTYVSALSASAGLASIRHGKQIHAHLIRALRDEDTAVSRILITLDDVTTKDFLFAVDGIQAATLLVL